MAFQQNYNGGNSNNNMNQGGDKKRTNFPVGKVYGVDGLLTVTIWNSDSAVYTIFQIKQAIGKDPSTGANAFEQKAPSELPRVFMNPEYLRAFIEAAKTQSEIHISPKKGSKIDITGIKSNQIKITIETEKQGTRTITFDAIPCGEGSIRASWQNLMELLGIAMKKALFAKLDPEEFGMALASENTTEEAPF